MQQDVYNEYFYLKHVHLVYPQGTKFLNSTVIWLYMSMWLFLNSPEIITDDGKEPRVYTALVTNQSLHYSSYTPTNLHTCTLYDIGMIMIVISLIVMRETET